jgi:hypothetical protein
VFRIKPSFPFSFPEAATTILTTHGNIKKTEQKEAHAHRVRITKNQN